MAEIKIGQGNRYCDLFYFLFYFGVVCLFTTVLCVSLCFLFLFPCLSFHMNVLFSWAFFVQKFDFVLDTCKINIIFASIKAG